MKNIKSKHNKTRSIVFMHTKTPSVTIQGNIYLRWGIEMTSFGRFFRYIGRANLGIIIWCWHGITHYVTRIEAH